MNLFFNETYKIYKKLKWINKGIKVILNKNIPKNVL